MSGKQKRSTGRFTIGLTFALLFLCALVSVGGINLFIVPLFQAANQPPIVAGFSQIAKATATVDFEDGPPPPATPTGEFPTPLPTLSKDELHKLPTAEYPRDAPTLEPTQEVDSIAPTLAPIVSEEPSQDWIVFVDPNLGFSLEYPSNWFLTSPGNLPTEFLNARGTLVILESYRVEGDTKGGVPKNALKIELHVAPEFALYDSIDAWFADYEKREQNSAQEDPTYTLSDVQSIKSNDVELVQWRQGGAGEPAGGLYAAVGKGKWLYFFSAYPANSEYQNIFDKVVASLKIQ